MSFTEQKKVFYRREGGAGKSSNLSLKLKKWVTDIFHNSYNIDNAAQQAAQGETPGTIWHAVKYGKLEEFKNWHEAVVARGELREKMLERGKVGETPYHFCFLYMRGKCARRHIIDILLQSFPEGCSVPYGPGPFEGETCLHMAIVRNNIDLVKSMLAVDPNLVYQCTTGDYFKPPSETYFGGYPLFLAACLDNMAIVDIILEIDPTLLTLSDICGNTIFHIIVIYNRKEMFECLEKRCPDNAVGLWDKPNLDGLTPFTLAASLGNREVFQFLLQRKSRIEWTYGGDAFIRTDIKDLDTGYDEEMIEHPSEADPPMKRVKTLTKFSLGRNSTTQSFTETINRLTTSRRKSALEWLVEMEHFQLLDEPAIQTILIHKWTCYGKHLFRKRFVMWIIYLILYTTALTLRMEPDSPSNYCTPLMRGASPTNFVTYIIEIIVFSVSMKKLFVEYKEIMSDGWNHFTVKGSPFIENCASFVHCNSLLAVFLIRIAAMRSSIPRRAEDTCLVLSSISGFSYLLFFFLGFRFTGPFILVILYILRKDVLRFTIIHSVFVMGFSAAFYSVIGESGGLNLMMRFRQCFLLVLGSDTNLNEMPSSDTTLINILLVVYMIIAAILLLNLLIAMMTETFQHIIANANHQWFLERARIIFALEGEMNHKEKMKFRYWIKLPNDQVVIYSLVKLKDWYPDMGEDVEQNDLNDFDAKITLQSRLDAARQPALKGSVPRKFNAVVAGVTDSSGNVEGEHPEVRATPSFRKELERDIPFNVFIPSVVMACDTGQ